MVIQQSSCRLKAEVKDSVRGWAGFLLVNIEQFFIHDSLIRILGYCIATTVDCC